VTSDAMVGVSNIGLCKTSHRKHTIEDIVHIHLDILRWRFHIWR